MQTGVLPRRIQWPWLWRTTIASIVVALALITYAGLARSTSVPPAWTEPSPPPPRPSVWKELGSAVQRNRDQVALLKLKVRAKSDSDLPKPPTSRGPTPQP